MTSRELADAIRALALSLPEAYEDEPWGHPVFKISLTGGQEGTADVPKGSIASREGSPSRDPMFGAMSEEAGCVRLTVKLTAEEREVAMLLPFVERARYVGRYGWVTAEVRDTETLDCALEWLRESYWLRAPIDRRDAAWE